MRKIFKSIFTIWFVAFIFTIAPAQPVGAGDPAVNPIYIPNPKVFIGGWHGWGEAGGVEITACGDGVEGECLEISWLGDYISAVYKYGVGIAVVLAVVMIMAGGFIWLLSAGSPDKVGKAKEFITSALTGLFLALFSVMILATVNPRLVTLKPMLVPRMSEVVVDGVKFGETSDLPGRPTGWTLAATAENTYYREFLREYEQWNLNGEQIEIRNYNFRRLTSEEGGLLVDKENTSIASYEIKANSDVDAYIRGNFRQEGSSLLGQAYTLGSGLFGHETDFNEDSFVDEGVRYTFQEADDSGPDRWVVEVPVWNARATMNESVWGSIRAGIFGAF